MTNCRLVSLWATTRTIPYHGTPCPMNAQEYERIPGLLEEYKQHTGRDAADGFPDWKPCHRALLGEDT
jgi:hypothetical protein